TEGLHAAGLHPPFRDQPVRGKPSMQMTRCCSVLVVHIAAHNGAEPFNIEESILDLERIECPLDQVNPAPHRVFSLLQLQTPAYASVSIPGKYTQHVTMQIQFVAGLE